MHFALSNAALPWWWVTAHLHDQQIFIGAYPATQHCCQPVILHSIDEQWGMYLP